MWTELATDRSKHARLTLGHLRSRTTASIPSLFAISRRRGWPDAAEKCHILPAKSLRSFFSAAVFDVHFKVSEVMTKRPGQHNGFDDRTDFHSHSCSAAGKLIERDNADAEVLGNSLPGDPTVGYAHYDLDVALNFFAIDDRRAGEARVIDLVDASDGRDKPREFFEA